MNLEEVRKNIDKIDKELLKLMCERFEYALRAKKLKGYVYDPKREQEVLAKVKSQSKMFLSPDFSEKLFKQIINESRSIEECAHKLIGFQGEHGAYSEIAARTFNPLIISIPCLEFEDVFEGVENNEFDFGIVPVENSLEGAVSQVNDFLVETKLKIVGEVKVPIHHSLIAAPETNYQEIKIVYSHPHALGQCRSFIVRNKLEPRPFYDTAGAAKMIAKEMPRNAAAIASKLAAEFYNLQIVKENIEDYESNSTRFLVLSKEKSNEKGNKCSIAFSTKHEPGALFKILQLFAKEEINLTRIESRPIKSDPGKYTFLVDFEGSDQEKKIANMLVVLKSNSEMFNFLGCYKQWSK